MNLLLHLLGLWICAQVTIFILIFFVADSDDEVSLTMKVAGFLAALFTLGWYLIGSNWGAL